MKEIVLPEGFEVDFEKYTKDKVILKAIEKKLPESVEDLKSCVTYYSDGSKSCQLYHPTTTHGYVSVKAAKSAKAKQMLGFLIKEYNGDWRPDWNNRDQDKYCILRTKNGLKKDILAVTYQFIVLKNEILCDKFFSHFERLIKDYFELD